jgi:hypothetical protein
MGTATDPATAPFDTAGASTDDDGAADPLVERIAAAIDRWVWHRNGPRDAAVRVLADEQLRDALRAADVVATLDREHQPRRWGDQSDVVVCDCCQRSWPCSVRAALDGAVT